MPVVAGKRLVMFQFGLDMNAALLIAACLGLPRWCAADLLASISSGIAGAPRDDE